MSERVLVTERLSLRRFALDDDAFILELLNEPSFIANIGDRGVRTREDADGYLLKGPLASYEKHGYGLYGVELHGELIGMSGILKRDSLDHPDIGFAFLPRFWNQGYALEAARGVMRYARETLALDAIAAITSQDNQASIRLLQKIGFQFERLITLPGDATELRLFMNYGSRSTV